jgi:hypothetical protein
MGLVGLQTQGEFADVALIRSAAAFKISMLSKIL